MYSMKYICSLFFCLIISDSIFIIHPSYGHAAEVEHLRVSQVGNRLVAEYDLTGQEEADVVVTVTVGGKRYTQEDLHLEGDFGKVRPGAGKRIYWNVLQDFPRGLSAEVEVEVTAGGREWRDPVLGMEFVWVEGGCYEMGCGSWTSDCDDDEKPVHEVCVDGFWLGKYEVTFDEYDAYCRAAGKKRPDDEGWGRGRRPVIYVSWEDAQGFIGWLNRKTGLEFRLPTEAEWEYAARSGGRKEKWAGTSDEGRLGDYAWYGSNSGGRTHPVGTKRPNGLGLYDMSGNVWEWCSDRYGGDYYSKSPRRNPKGPAGGGDRVVRGGSWSYYARYVRVANRLNVNPADRYSALGFRLARTP